MSDELLGQRLAILHEDVAEMKDVLKELTRAVNKLALVEQQQTQMAEGMQRALNSIEKVEARVADIEKILPQVTRAGVWVDRMVWSAAAAAVMFAVKKTGLL